MTLSHRGTALFPDAPTVRGARHLRELADLARNGTDAAVLFCGGRDDIKRVRPHAAMDPDFANAAREAKASGVRFFGTRFSYTPRGATYAGRIPVSIR